MNNICKSCLFNNTEAFCCAVQRVRWSFNELAKAFLHETPIFRKFESVKNIEFDNRCYNYVKQQEKNG